MQPSFLKFFMVQFRHPEFGRCPKSVETWGKRYQLYLPRPRLLQRCRLRPRRVGAGAGAGSASAWPQEQSSAGALARPYDPYYGYGYGYPYALTVTDTRPSMVGIILGTRPTTAARATTGTIRTGAATGGIG